MTRQTVLAVHAGSELFGSDRMFLESVIGLCEAGHDVIVALPTRGPLIAAVQAAGARVVIIPMLVLRKSLIRPPGWADLARDGIQGFVAARRLLSSTRPDVVYVSTITLPHWPVAARLHGARVVSHVHEAEGHGSRLVNTVIYLPLTAAHTVIINSEYSKQVLGASLPRLLPRSQVIYNGVSGPDNPAPPRAALSSPLQLCYVGRLSHRKAPDLILAAARLLAMSGVPAHVTLVGSVFPGNEWYEQELRAIAAALPDGASAEFVGFTPTIWPHLAHSDVVIVPSRLDEPFGNTAVEGILALRPVIVSNTSGLREAAGGYESAQLISPDDPQELTEALNRVREGWGLVRESVAASRTRALGRHAPPRYRATISRAVTAVDVGVNAGVGSSHSG